MRFPLSCDFKQVENTRSWNLWALFSLLCWYLTIHNPILYVICVIFNPLTTNDGLLRHENFIFLWTWTLRWVPTSFAIHAFLCNTLPSNKLLTKTVKIPVVKGLNYQKVCKLWLFFTILIFLFKLSKSMKVMTFYHNFNILFTPLATNDGL